MLFNLIPRTLVKELISRYENYDICLDMDGDYNQLKNTILKKKILRLDDFNYFIENTKRSKYTLFNYNQNIYDKILKIAQSKKHISNIVISDVKFKKIQYIRFFYFNKSIYKQIKNIIELTPYQHLILDLRNNTGGKLEICLQILDLLIPAGLILTVSKNQGVNNYYSDNKFKPFEKIFILINDNTASCSEILCMVLKKKLDNVYIIGNKRDYKIYTQHVIYNRLYSFRFAITDGIWSLNNEGAEELHKYFTTSNKQLLELGDYMECINELLREGI